MKVGGEEETNEAEEETETETEAEAETEEVVVMGLFAAAVDTAEAPEEAGVVVDVREAVAGLENAEGSEIWPGTSTGADIDSLGEADRGMN